MGEVVSAGAFIVHGVKPRRGALISYLDAVQAQLGEATDL